MTDESPPAGGGPADQASRKTKEEETTWNEKVRTVGGLVAVVVGVVAVGVVAIIALTQGTEIASTIASSAGGVIATIVGAYFGVKIGTDQSKQALEGQLTEAAKAQVYAAHLPPDKAPDILRLADDAARAVKGE
jgi:hypothetical protein